MIRKIGLIYDPHITTANRRAHDGVMVVSDAIDRLNEEGVDWSLIGGDLRSPPLSHEEWGKWHGDPGNYYFKSDFEKAKALFDAELDSQYFVIRGNSDRPLEVYREVFPAEKYPRWYWFEDEGARYVFLDSNPHDGYHAMMDTQNFVSAPQISMLERLMDADPEIPTFVFCHAPLTMHIEVHDEWFTTVRGNIATSAGSYFWTLNHPSVQRVLERGRTVMVNSGHVYIDYGRGSKNVNGTEYVLGRHLVHPNDPDYGGDVRWLTVDTEDRSARVDYLDLGSGSEGTIVKATW